MIILMIICYKKMSILLSGSAKLLLDIENSAFQGVNLQTFFSGYSSNCGIYAANQTFLFLTI